jgi:sulfur carrier protein
MEPEVIVSVANGEQRRVHSPCTIDDLVETAGLKTTQVVVELNGQVVPRKDAASTHLKQGDNVEIIMPVAGG